MYLDVMNQTRKDKVLHKGEIVGSVHSVGAVIPMVKFGEDGESRPKDGETGTAQVGAVEGVVGEGGQSEQASGIPKWDLSHLDADQREKIKTFSLQVMQILVAFQISRCPLTWWTTNL